MQTKRPPCSKWALWKGPEIEGSTDRGVTTLFIRSLGKFGIPSIQTAPGPKASAVKSFVLGSKCNRLWFCKEFTNWTFIRYALKVDGVKVCIEVEPKCFENIPKDLRKRCTIYLKVPVELKAGDFVCVGPAFSDESFLIGTGVRVNPSDYLKDTKIA